MHIAVFLNRRAAAWYRALVLQEKNLPGRGLTKVENHWYIGHWWESQKESDHYEDQDVGGCTILRCIGWDGMDWIDLAQDKGPWRAIVNTVMNLRVQ
jgi:hypothetical protein